jgi:hypothetical protein
LVLRDALGFSSAQVAGMLTMPPVTPSRGKKFHQFFHFRLTLGRASLSERPLDG